VASTCLAAAIDWSEKILHGQMPSHSLRYPLREIVEKIIPILYFRSMQNQSPSLQDILSNPILTVYQKDVDITLIRENLKLSVEERILKLQDYTEFVFALQSAKKQPVELK